MLVCSRGVKLSDTHFEEAGRATELRADWRKQGHLESTAVRRPSVANARVVAVGRGGWIWIRVKTGQERFSDWLRVAVAGGWSGSQELRNLLGVGGSGGGGQWNQSYFYDNTEVLFAFFIALTFALILWKPWWVKLQHHYNISAGVRKMLSLLKSVPEM